MEYQQIITMALKGRSVNATAKKWGMSQKTLSRYTKGEFLPDYSTAKRIADEAGIFYDEMFIALALEDAKRKRQSHMANTEETATEIKPSPQEQKELAALQNTDYNSASVGALAQLVEQRTLNP